MGFDQQRILQPAECYHRSLYSFNTKAIIVTFSHARTGDNWENAEIVKWMLTVSASDDAELRVIGMQEGEKFVSSFLPHAFQKGFSGFYLCSDAIAISRDCQRSEFENLVSVHN